MSTQKSIDRRSFVKKSLKAGAINTLALTGFPTIVPASVFGKNAPSNKINIGPIGAGRISREHDTETIKHDKAKIIAVCDIDSKRLTDGKKYANDYYSKKTGAVYDGVTMYNNDHRELLLNKDIDER